MSKTDPVIERLRREDLELSKAGMPPHVDARIHTRLFAPARSSKTRGVVLTFGFACAAAVVALVFVPGELLKSTEPSALFSVVSGCHDSADAQRGTLAKGAQACVVQLKRDDVKISTRSRARLLREGRRIRVKSGRVHVEVTPKPRRLEPVEFSVSHGTIRVLGTVFTIDQQQEGGSVTLHRGAIEFVVADGTTMPVRAGQTLTWPLPIDSEASEPFALDEEIEQEAAKQVEEAENNDKDGRSNSPKRLGPRGKTAEAGAPLPRKPTPRQLSTLLAQVERLRAQGRYRRAVAKLRSSMRNVVDPVVAERLSFEMGSLLTYQLGSSPQGCLHWNRHLRRFGKGRYEDGLERAYMQLGCAPPAGERQP